MKSELNSVTLLAKGTLWDIVHERWQWIKKQTIGISYFRSQLISGKSSNNATTNHIPSFNLYLGMKRRVANQMYQIHIHKHNEPRSLDIITCIYTAKTWSSLRHGMPPPPPPAWTIPFSWWDQSIYGAPGIFMKVEYKGSYHSRKDFNTNIVWFVSKDCRFEPIAVLKIWVIYEEIEDSLTRRERQLLTVSYRL